MTIYDPIIAYMGGIVGVVPPSCVLEAMNARLKGPVLY